MIVDAISKRTNIDKNRARVDVYSPKFRTRPVMQIGIEHENKTVKFFTDPDDLNGIDIDTINGVSISTVDLKKTGLPRGAIARCKDDSIVYIYLPTVLVT